MVEVLGVVPARGGSKSIPGKNIRLLGDAPLLAYSIAAGQQSRHVTRVIVSTDSPQIAAVAQEWGAEVPFMRPDKLASDTSLDLELFEHALNWLDTNEGYRPDMVVQLRPTTPLRPPGCVDEAVEILRANPDSDSVRSVTSPGQNPYKMWRLDAEGAMLPLLGVEGLTEPYNMPRQELPPTLWQTGHIDVFRPDVVLAKQSMSGKRIHPLMIDHRYCVDIDELSDWERAEWLVHQATLAIISPQPPIPNGIA